jgi:hypothetical protein
MLYEPRKTFLLLTKKLKKAPAIKMREQADVLMESGREVM